MTARRQQSQGGSVEGDRDGKSKLHLRLMRTARRYGFLLTTCSAMVLGACGGSSSGDHAETLKSTSHFQGIPRIQPTTGKPPKRGRPVQWVVLGRPLEQQVRIGTGYLSFCVEIPESRPEITAVRERSRRDGTVFTAYVVGGYQPGCAEVAVRPEVVIRLKQPLGNRKLYDDSKTPPIQRWPE